MTVTLELKPEIESCVNAKAKRSGKSVETFLVEIIEYNINSNIEEKPFYQTASKEDWIAELDSLTIYSDKISTTFDDSRESIYGERESVQI